MMLSRVLKLTDTPIGIKIKVIAFYNLYATLLTKAFNRYKRRTTKFPEGLQTIVENNYQIDASITESLKALTYKASRLLSRSSIQKYLQDYDFSLQLKRSKLISDMKVFRLPFSLAILVLPYINYLLVTKIITLVAQNNWNKHNNSYARMLVKNLKYISSTETRDIWLELCYLNNYISGIDKQKTYTLLSKESKSYIQSSLHRVYKLDTSKFITELKKPRKDLSLMQRIQGIINSLYRKYIVVYLILFLITVAFVEYLLYYLSANIAFTLISLPLTLLTSYEVTNSLLHSVIPQRKTLSLNPKITTVTSTVAACIPFIISTTADIARIRAEIERLAVSNTSYKNINYFILVDFADSFTANDDNIPELQAALGTLCDSLNRTISYGDRQFYYFLRQSLFSERQKRFMGWERKRGKLVEFIQYLHGDQTRSTVYSDYTPTSDKPFKYMFVVDEGSHVSKNIIQELLLRAENINNIPIANNSSNIVLNGYAVFQPRISSKQNFNKTFFQALFNKFEKYHTYSATEDLTFSIFGEYYFQGKGLINIEMYRKICIQQIPDDILLSHDLIEGSYLRVAHVDTCTIFEPFPSGFDPYIQRLNRWMRGDINSLLWLLPSLKHYSVQFASKDIGVLAKVRITVNLLNVIKAPLLLLAPLSLPLPILGFLINWLFSQFSWLLTLLKEVQFFFTKKHSIAFKFAIFQKKIDYWRMFEFLSLPIHAANSIHAMVTSFVRLFITRNHTLTWVTSRRSEDSTKTLSTSFMKKLLLLLAVVIIFNQLYGLFLIALTVCAIAIASVLNRKLPGPKKLSIPHVKYLRRVSRLTWKFFEKYVTTETSYLPPDNVTKGTISKFTSITNIGFYLLSLISAHKLGFISRKRFLRYFKRSFGTILKLPKYHGHFYNWYNINTLKVYTPNFLSSVDSGNFYACLACTKQYLKKLKGTDTFAEEIELLLENMKFSYFINKFDQLSVGYSVTKQQLSKDNYDHFASESRLAVYIAVAKDNVSENAWGGLLRPFNKNGSLLSWGGTVFEYLLPQLFLKTYLDSLSTNSLIAILSANMRFAAKYRLPWGLSESLYVNESTKAYEYKPIGISELSRDPLQIQRLTVAPYATALMLQINLESAIRNFAELERLNLLTEFGFYEAITFSKTSRSITIDSFMAHHQGMIMASITNSLATNMFVRLFNSYVSMDTVDYLLDEDQPNYPEINDAKLLKFSITEE